MKRGETVSDGFSTLNIRIEAEWEMYDMAMRAFA